MTAQLPASAPNTRFHVRLVVENDRGRAAGEDRLVTMPGPPALRASLRGRRLRSRILAHGVALRIRSTGRLVTVRGWLRRRGDNPLVLHARLPWTAGATRTIRVPLTARGRRLLRHAARPRLTLTLIASGPGGRSRPVRLSLPTR